MRRLLHALAPSSILDPVFWLRIALVFVAEFAFTRGYRYTVEREPVPMAIELISGTISVLGYGVAWFAAAAAAMVSIPRAWPIGSLPTILLSLVFAFGFTLSWITSPVASPGHADYANAGTYWFVMGALTCGFALARAALKGSPSPGDR